MAKKTTEQTEAISIAEKIARLKDLYQELESHQNKLLPHLEIEVDDLRTAAGILKNINDILYTTPYREGDPTSFVIGMAYKAYWAMTRLIQDEYDKSKKSALLRAMHEGITAAIKNQKIILLKISS